MILGEILFIIIQEALRNLKEKIELIRAKFSTQSKCHLCTTLKRDIVKRVWNDQKGTIRAK